MALLLASVKLSILSDLLGVILCLLTLADFLYGCHQKQILSLKNINHLKKKNE